jgi:hypothetical protein
MTYAINSSPDVSPINQGTIQLHAPNEDAAITLHAHNADEMIRVTKDGFYVRGVRVPADAQEAETVYNAFKQWMTWATLQQRR